MKITTISYMERKNKGNYEHEEMSATAILHDEENHVTGMSELRNAVHNALHGIGGELPQGIQYIPQPLCNDDVQDNAKKEEVKEKKTRAKKEKVTEVKEVAEGIVVNTESFKEEVKVKPLKVTKYSSDVAEHKSIFGAYLTKAYGNTWKTVKPVAEIKEFTASLNGMDFITDDGIMVDSFLETVKGFFGA